MMPYIKRFCISGSAFHGWHTDIDLDEMDSNNDISRAIKERMLKWVADAEKATGQDDMYGLKRAIEELTLFFHNMSFGDVLLTDMEIIYLCHCTHDHGEAESNGLHPS